MLKKGNADPNITTNKEGATALTVASQFGHASVVKVLIKGDAQVDTVYKGQTPSMMATSQGNETVVETINTLINNDTKCAKCSKSALDLGRILLKCGRCKKVYYCNKECQKAHWKIHKPVCSI